MIMFGLFRSITQSRLRSFFSLDPGSSDVVLCLVDRGGLWKQGAKACRRITSFCLTAALRQRQTFTAPNGRLANREFRFFTFDLSFWSHGDSFPSVPWCFLCQHCTSRRLVPRRDGV